MKSEIEALATLGNELQKLDDQARERVVRWAIAYFCIEGFAIGSRAAESEVAGPDVAVNPEVGGTAPEHFAEFFSAAKPQTPRDKALVAAYWLQVVVGDQTWESARLNRELRQLGHTIPSISKVLGSLIDAKPQLVLQIRKNGGTRQARKTYKLTAEGTGAVDRLAAGGVGV